MSDPKKNQLPQKAAGKPGKTGTILRTSTLNPGGGTTPGAASASEKGGPRTSSSSMSDKVGRGNDAASTAPVSELPPGTTSTPPGAASAAAGGVLNMGALGLGGEEELGKDLQAVIRILQGSINTKFDEIKGMLNTSVVQLEDKIEKLSLIHI